MKCKMNYRRSLYRSLHFYNQPLNSLLRKRRKNIFSLMANHSLFWLVNITQFTFTLSYFYQLFWLVNRNSLWIELFTFFRGQRCWFENDGDNTSITENLVILLPPEWRLGVKDKTVCFTTAAERALEPAGEHYDKEKDVALRWAC